MMVIDGRWRFSHVDRTSKSLRSPPMYNIIIIIFVVTTVFVQTPSTLYVPDFVPPAAAEGTLTLSTGRHIYDYKHTTHARILLTYTAKLNN